MAWWIVPIECPVGNAIVLLAQDPYQGLSSLVL